MEDTCVVWEEEGSGVRDGEAGEKEGVDGESRGVEERAGGRGTPS